MADRLESLSGRGDDVELGMGGLVLALGEGNVGDTEALTCLRHEIEREVQSARVEEMALRLRCGADVQRRPRRVCVW